MKKILFITSFVAAQLFGFCQNINRDAVLGNFGQYLQGFVEGYVQDSSYNKLTQYENDKYVKISFNIDTIGIIKDLSVEKNGIPDSIVSYIKDLIMGTDKSWLPQIKNGKVVQSDTITCYFLFKNKYVVMRERFKELLKPIDISANISAQQTGIFINYGKPNYCFVFLKIP